MKRLIVLLLPLLIQCSLVQKRDVYGVIVEKYYIREHSVVRIMNVGSPGFRSPIEMTETYPEDWVFTIHLINNQTKTFSVSEYCYNKFKKGDFIHLRSFGACE